MDFNKSYILNKLQVFFLKSLKKAIKIYIYICHKFGLVFPIYLLWRVSLSELNVKHSKASKKVIIVFGSTGGEKDIESAYSKHTSENIFLQINHWYIQESCNFYISGSLDDYNNTLNLSPWKDRRLYRDFIKLLIGHLRDRLNVVGFINFNNAYYAQRDFAGVSVLSGCPFITLHKECFRSPCQIQKTIELYAKFVGEYQGSRIGVHNIDMRNSLVHSGVISEDRVLVVGQARSSMLVNNNCAKDKCKKSILYFSISNRAGLLSAYSSTYSSASWGEYDLKIRDMLIEYSKAKGVKLYIKEKQKTNLNIDKHSNLEVVNSHPDMNLFCKSSVVVGFNTTAMLEAVMANIPVVSPYVDIKGQHDECLFDWLDCIQISYTKEDFYRTYLCCITTRCPTNSTLT